MALRRLVALGSMVLVSCSSQAMPDASSADAWDASDVAVHPVGCDPGPGATGDRVQMPDGHPYCSLSDYALFAGAMAQQQPATGVVPYDVNAPLFADYAVKHRFVYVPAGAHIGFVAADRWQLPVGSVLVKTFAFPHDARDPSTGERLIETRLLLHQASGYRAVSYQWNDAQTDATYVPVPAPLPVQWIDATGATRTDMFRPPNQAECGDCHGSGNGLDPTGPLGLRTGQLNRVFDYGGGVSANQIDHLAAMGLFDVAPPAASTLERFSDPFGSDPLDARARGYLHANCAYCHSDDGHARDTSGLRLNIEEPVGLQLGICKSPTMIDRSGGLSFDIVPGDPAHSILPYRMMLALDSPSAASMMPVLGRTVAHTEAVDLINQWIAAMPAQRCGM